MSEKSDSQPEQSQETRVEGAVKAGNGEYFFKLEEMSGIDAGPDYSTAHGPVIEGDRMQVGLIHKSEGTGSRLHKHSNEQFNYVVKGTLRVKIEDNDPVDAEEGTVVYIPPDTPHWSRAAPGTGECYFYVAKDAAQGIIGNPIDDSTSDVGFEEGYGPDDDKRPQND